MPTAWQRDLEAAAPRFLAWLRGEIPESADLEMSPLTAPETSGFSNETLFCDLRWSEAGRGRRESIVIRIEPSGYRVFPDYDLAQQCRIMQLLARTDLPVPTVLWLGTADTEVFGAPFYVMRRVEGRVPSDNPPYHSAGWMTEIAPAERRAIWLGGFEAMARIHRLDIDQAGFAFLRRPKLGRTGLEQELAYYTRFLQWAGSGREQPIAEAALEWLEKNKPGPEPEGLVWGDARIGNIVFGERGTVAAVLDWEMASIGSPEKDVAWAIFLDRHHSEGLGVNRLEGFPSYEESLAYYEELSGHEIEHLHYYQVFAGFRFSIIMMRISQQLVFYELMTEQQGRDFELDNTCTRLTAELLDLAPPVSSS